MKLLLLFFYLVWFLFLINPLKMTNDERDYEFKISDKQVLLRQIEKIHSSENYDLQFEVKKYLEKEITNNLENFDKKYNQYFLNIDFIERNYFILYINSVINSWFKVNNDFEIEIRKEEKKFLKEIWGEVYKRLDNKESVLSDKELLDINKYFDEKIKKIYLKKRRLDEFIFQMKSL